MATEAKPDYAKAISGLLVIGLFAYMAWCSKSNYTEIKPVTAAPQQAAEPPNTDTQRAVLLSRVGLISFSWHREAFDTVMVVNFTITNPTEYGFKDFEVTCTHSGPSGTMIDSNIRTIYRVVPPHSTKRIRDFQMGFIHSQVTGSYCQITNLVPVYVPEEKKPAKKQSRQAADNSNLPLEKRGGWVVAPEKR